MKYGARSAPQKEMEVNVMFPAPALAGMLRIELELTNSIRNESYNELELTN